MSWSECLEHRLYLLTDLLVYVEKTDTPRPSHFLDAPLKKSHPIVIERQLPYTLAGILRIVDPVGLAIEPIAVSGIDQTSIRGDVSDGNQLDLIL